jgi:hypothetical protein
MKTRYLIRSVFPLLALLLILAACNGDDDADQSPDEIVDAAITAFDETESARFTIEIEGAIPIDAEGLLALSSVEGELERPESARADAGIVFAGSRVTMELVAVDGEMFLRNILTGNWERAPSDLQYDPSAVFDDNQGIGAILAQLDELEHEGSDTIQGIDTWHLSGTAPASAVASLTGDFFDSDTLFVDLWIAQDEHYLVRVELREIEDQDEADWVLTLFDHNEPVSIARPELD